MKKNYKYLIVVIFFFSHAGKAQIQSVLDAEQFEKAINDTSVVQLLDVRTPGEFNTGHIKNALQADWNDQDEFARRIAFIDKQQPVYIYCLGGSRSAEAAKKMREMGYTNLYELKGGFNAWKNADKTVEGRSTEKQLSITELKKAINTSKIVLVDFGAEWCPPCKKMEPVLKSLQKNYPGQFTLIKVDGGRDENIMKAYQVTKLPVFIIFREGKQVWRKEGIAAENEMAIFLK